MRNCHSIVTCGPSGNSFKFLSQPTFVLNCGTFLFSGKPDNSEVKEDLNGKLLDMYSSIYTMRTDLERIKKPQGSKDNPVRSCKDLYFGHPQFKDGKGNIFNCCLAYVN